MLIKKLYETLGKQAKNLTNITSSYEHCKKHWAAIISHLQEKIKLSHEAHACAESIPELNKMVIGVQAVVVQWEDIKVKYSEEQAKRKELYNQIQDTKGKVFILSE